MDPLKTYTVTNGETVIVEAHGFQLANCGSLLFNVNGLFTQAFAPGSWERVVEETDS